MEDTLKFENVLIVMLGRLNGSDTAKLDVDLDLDSLEVICYGIWDPNPHLLNCSANKTLKGQK